jgi:cell division protein FtsW
MNRLLNKFEGDRSLWIIVLLMMMGSIVTTFSFVSILIKVEEGTLSGYMFKHIIFVALAIYGMYWIHKKDPQFVAKYTSLAFLLSIALLIYTALFGMKVNDAGRWVKIPVINLTFQTSDFAKLAIILFLSRQLVIFKDRLDEWKIVFWKLLIPIILVVGLIFRDNFSTAALVFMICMVILFIGQVPFTKLLTIAGVLLGGLALVIVIQLNFPEIKILPRLTTWVNRVTNRYAEPENTIDNAQAANAELAIHNGGLIGQGFGDGKLKDYLPEAYADFYYASFVEETGFIGGLILVILYGWILFRIVRFSVNTDNLFQRYVSFGIGFHIISQASINMLVCTGIFPVTGQNMPFLAMGGSSLVMVALSIGIYQSFYLNAKKQKVKEEPNDN